MVCERAARPRSLGAPSPSLSLLAGGDAVDAAALSFLVRQTLLEREKQKQEEKEKAKVKTLKEERFEAQRAEGWVELVNERTSKTNAAGLFIVFPSG